MTETRAQRIFRALAGHPEGLTTPEIMELGGERDPSGQRVLPDYGKLLRRHEGAGHVRRAGVTEGDSGQFGAVIWQLAPGARAEDFAPHAPPAEPDYEEPLYRLFPRTMAGARAAGLLNGRGYQTLGDLLYVTGTELLAVPEVGPDCLEAAREALGSRGLVLVDELDLDDLDET